jgi:hypothetical protein
VVYAGGETYTVIGSADVSLRPFVADLFPSLLAPPSDRPHSTSIASSLDPPSPKRGLEKREFTDWFPLFDKHTGLALQDDAALQLKLKYLP